MIEENVINWVDLGEAKTTLDIYGQKPKMIFFKFLKSIKQYNNLSITLNLFLQIIFFIQFSTLSLNGLYDNDDYIAYIFEYLSDVFLLYTVPDSPLIYEILVLIMFLITLIFISLLLYIFICVKRDVKPASSALYLLSIFIQIEIYYLIGPVIGLSLTSIVCKNGNKHIILNEKCFSNPMHLVIFVASAISLVFHIGFSVILSVYYYDIGNMGEYGSMTRVPCNYEIYLNLSVIVLFTGHSIFKFYIELKKWYLVIWEVVVFIFAFLFTIYVFRYVFFYNNKKNLTLFTGWTMCLWFCLMILLKNLLNVYDSTLFQIVGWLIIVASIFSYLKIKYIKIITDFNIFEGKHLRDIEIYEYSLLNLIENKSYLSKTLLHGYINRFEEFLLSNPDLSGKYQKLKNDPYLNKKLVFENTTSIYAIIYIIYSFHIEKYISHSAELTISMCYFLINELKNPTYAVYLCSELKVRTHLQLYYKYLLMEQIKEYLINKITYSSNKNSIKHVEIGSVILYNIFGTLLHLKIYDATASQIDYFDNFKSSITTKKTTENFLKSGDEILKLREKIIGIWDQIIQLNPFNSDIENDYMLYIKTIIQDDFLAKTEEKKNYSLKNKNLCLRQNTYFTMFAEDKSSFLLIDGASDANLKILYTTPNFPKLFMFSGKEMLNTSVNDLLPSLIQKIHKDLVDDSIKYSNVDKAFKSPQDVLVKTKNNGLINIKLYVKCVPNLSYGLNYFAYLSKMKDKNFIIILDKDFRISSFTENFGDPYNKSEGENFIINGNNFGLTQSVYGHHIGMVIPEILLLISFDEEKNCFYFTKPDIELKGNLFPINPWGSLDRHVDYFLEKIKSNKNDKNQISNDEGDVNNFPLDFTNFVYEIKKKFPKPVSVFYKLKVKTFLRGTFKYYRIYISNDLVKMNQIKSENENSSQGSFTGDDDERFTGTILNKQATLTNDFKRQEAKKKKEIKFAIAKNNQKKKNNDIVKSKEEKKEDEKKESNEKEEEEQKSDVEAKNKTFNMQVVGSQHKIKKGGGDGSNIVSSDEAKFNKLKKHVLDNDETILTFYMKLLNTSFGLLTIFCIVYDSIINRNNMISLNKYLTENLIFNHTKLTTGILYTSATQYKYYIDGYIKDESCLTDICRNIYINNIITCLDDLSAQKAKFSDLSEDFTEKVETIDTIDIYSSLENYDEVEIDLEFIINLLINYGLRVKDLAANGINPNDTEKMNKYEIASMNLRSQSNYLVGVDVNGFRGQEKTNKINKLFTPTQVSLIIMVIYTVLFVGIFFYILYYLYTYEVFFIEKLIDFSNPQFEAYLKTLEELKKKLRNESEEDDDEDKEDEFGIGTAMGTKKDDDDTNKNNKNNKEDQKKEKEEQKITKRLRGKEKNKLQHQQKKKKSIMINFFVKINLYFCIRIFILALLGITYYIFSSIIKSTTKSNYLEHEAIADDTQSVYKESLEIFLNLSREISKYEEIEHQKNLAIQKLNSENSSGYVIIYNKKCTDETCIKNSNYYKMNLPNSESIVFPKLGNLLMPIVSNVGDDTSSIKYKFNQLYNGDACSLLFSETQRGFNVCSNYWNGILTKGMEQAMTQMSVSITSVLDELKSIDEYDGNSLSILFKNDSELFQYQNFVEYYFYKSFLETCEMFDILKEEIIKSIEKKIYILLIFYCAVSLVLFLLILAYISSLRTDFNAFLDFIVIFPMKFLVDDEFLYRHTVKFGSSLFR